MVVAQTVAPKTISVLLGWLLPPKIVRREPTRPPVIKSIAFPISQVGQLILEQPPLVAGLKVMNHGILLDILMQDLLFAYHVAHYVWPVVVMLLHQEKPGKMIRACEQPKSLIITQKGGPLIIWDAGHIMRIA
jgi:hypothetical protein